MWWYIYDEDNLSARVHSPSLKSPNNVPEACSSLQMEVYCKQNEYTEQQLLDRTVGKLVEIGVIKEEDIGEVSVENLEFWFNFCNFSFYKTTNTKFNELLRKIHKTLIN